MREDQPDVRLAGLVVLADMVAIEDHEPAAEHGADGRGNEDYGAPDLTRNVWNSGGDPQSLFAAIYSGQHRIMPGWRRTLSLLQIRALATYVYAASHAG